MDKKLNTYVCNECIYGCELKSCAVPVRCHTGVPSARPAWRKVADDLPDFLKVGEWVYDSGSSEYAKITDVSTSDKTITCRFLGSKRDIIRDYEYVEEFLTEACLLPYNDPDMTKLVGTAIVDKYTGDTCLVVGSFFNQAAEERMITLYLPESDIISYDPDDLLEHYDKLDGSPCGNLMRKDENGEWI
jgi:hypothetical protein